MENELKIKAIKIIQEIQNGNFDRNNPICPKGDIAKLFWEDATFAYGMEYGAIVALMRIADLTIDDFN